MTDSVNNVMRHEYRVLSDKEKAQMQAVKDAGLQLWQMLDDMEPGGRELALAKTKLEECVMWAGKAITR